MAQRVGYIIAENETAGGEVITGHTRLTSSPVNFIITGTATGMTIQPETSSDGVSWVPFRDPDTSTGFNETVDAPLALAYCSMLNYVRLKITGGTGTIEKITVNS